MAKVLSPNFKYTNVNYSINVYAIIENAGYVLLTKDNYEGYESKNPGWKLPGGGVNANELLLDALKREVKEEVGLEIVPERLLSVSNWHRKDKGITRLRIYFIAKSKSRKIKPTDDEVAEYRWFTKSELKKLKRKDFFLAPHYYPVVRAYLDIGGADAIMTISKTARKERRYDIFLKGK